MFTCSDSVMGLERFCDGLAFAKKTTASSHSHSANHAPSAYPWNPHRIRTRTGDTFEGTGGYIIIIYIYIPFCVDHISSCLCLSFAGP
jgi:hypothetical protein